MESFENQAHESDIKVLFLLLTAPTIAAQQPASDSSYKIQDSVLIPLRNGHSISSIIVSKKGETRRLPVILFYTTYQGPGDSFFGKISADKGYVGIVAYARGIRTNLEDYFPSEHDGTDVYDIIDWLSRRVVGQGKLYKG